MNEQDFQRVIIGNGAPQVLQGFSIPTVLETAKSDPVDITSLPSPVIEIVDKLAARVLDGEKNKLILMGFAYAGKSFIFEQLVYNIDKYLVNSSYDDFHFFVLTDINMLELGNSVALRNAFESMKKVLSSDGTNICFITESLEASQFVASILPEAKVVLEINVDAFFNVITNSAPGSRKSWGSWEVVDVNFLNYTAAELVDLMHKTIVTRLNKTSKQKLSYEDVSHYVSQVLVARPDIVDEEDGVITVPIGVWATCIRYFMGSLAFTVNPKLLNPDGTPNFQKVLEKSIEEVENLLNPYASDDDDEDGIPGFIASIMSSEGNVMTLGGNGNSSKTVEVPELDFGNMSTLPQRLKDSIMGQDEAIDKLVDCLTIPAAKLNDPTKPLRSFLFLGPTGVGKTQLALNLAETVAKEPMNVIRVDMSEYQQQHEVAKLLGAPPGYIGFDSGSHLLSEMQKHPNSIVILDEIEKAHPKIWDSFLQVFDSGKMTSGKGVTVDFSGAIIIMTSNIGAIESKPSGVGFFQGETSKSYESRQTQKLSIIMHELEKVFRPEFLNRIDELVFFRELPRTILGEIIKNEISIFTERLALREVSLGGVSEDIVTALLDKSDISKYGAREIQRIVYKNIATPVARFISSHEDVRSIVLNYNEKEITVSEDHKMKDVE